MNNENTILINFNMNNNQNISNDKMNTFKKLILKYLINQIVGEEHDKT